VSTVLVEEPEPEAPYGAKGVGEPPLISSPAAIAAALRAASGRRLGRLPVSPGALAGLEECEQPYPIRPGQPPSV
jgi:CO/xanthine dehydrogenase Mo-binding subunit